MTWDSYWPPAFVLLQEEVLQTSIESMACACQLQPALCTFEWHDSVQHAQDAGGGVYSDLSYHLEEHLTLFARQATEECDSALPAFI